MSKKYTKTCSYVIKYAISEVDFEIAEIKYYFNCMNKIFACINEFEVTENDFSLNENGNNHTQQLSKFRDNVFPKKYFHIGYLKYNENL